MSRRRRWILWPLAAFALAILVLAVVWDWSWFKGVVEDRASAALGRQVQIEGDLQVDLSLTPTVALHQVKLANADWGSRPNMLTIERVAAAIELWPILDGEIVLPFVEVEQPDVLLEKNAQGQANWQLGQEQQEEGGPPAVPVLRDLQVTNAVVRYHDPALPEPLVAEIDPITGHLLPAEPGIGLEAKGQVADRSFQLALDAGTLSQLKQGREPFPFALDLALGQARLTVDGSAQQLLEAQGIQATVELVSEQPQALLELAGLPQRDLGAVDVRVKIAQENATWSFDPIEAEVGQSDLSGRAAIELAGEQPRITANLRSDTIDFADFGGLPPVLTPGRAQGSDAAPGNKQQAADEQASVDAADGSRESAEGDHQGDVLTSFRPQEYLPPVDADLRYQASRIVGQDLAFKDVRFTGVLKDRLPLVELAADGNYQGLAVVLDARLGASGRNPEAAYPIEAQIEVGKTSASLDGSIAQPQQLQAIDVRFEVQSANPAEVARLVGVALPSLPAVELSGALHRDGEVYRLDGFTGSLGKSVLAGELRADLSSKRPQITGDLHSERLLVDEIMAALEDEAAAAKGDAADQSGDGGGMPPIVTERGINFDALPEVDADVSFQGDYVSVQEFTFDPLRMDISLRERIAVFDLVGDGSFRDDPLSLEIHAGNEQSLEDPDAAYPMSAHLARDNTTIALEGTVGRPRDYTGLDIDVALEGPNLEKLGEILQIELPVTAPYGLSAHLTHAGAQWSLVDLNGKVGDSDLRGRVTLDFARDRPTIIADLSSRKLDFDDLGVLVGRPPARGEGETGLAPEARREAAEAGSDRYVLPTDPFEVPDLRVVDARVNFTGEEIQAPRLPLQRMSLEILLENGVLRVTPLRFGLGGGELVAYMTLDATRNPIHTSYDVRANRVNLNKVLAGADIEIAEIEVEKEGAGTFHGRIKLESTGNSVHEAAAHADGTMAVVMDGGRINALIVEAIGLDIGEALSLLLTDEEERQAAMVPIRCFVGRFDIERGVMQTEALVLDTPDSQITGAGVIDLGEEQIDLQFEAHPKDNSVLTASTPVKVEGSFRDPLIELTSEELEDKALQALGLGVALPVVGAIIPFIETGEEEGQLQQCGKLLEAAEAAGAGG